MAENTEVMERARPEMMGVDATGMISGGANDVVIEPKAKDPAMETGGISPSAGS